MIKSRGLFIIIVSIFVFFKTAKIIDPKDLLAYIMIGTVTGWGIDRLIEKILEKAKTKKEMNVKIGKDKILDSSAIIDGRIMDILDTGFVEGNIVIPRFVLEELQLLADSRDGMKRAKGRRGLDLIKMIQKDEKIKTIIEDKDYKIKEVDSKLIKLAKDTDGDVITTDFNLNKVATIQGVKVLNINELSNALKPVVIPNEELTIELMKSGDRDGQAIGYLNDGTMVVAEDGGDSIGKVVTLLVTSVYPTAAGRMIFGKIKK